MVIKSQQYCCVEVCLSQMFLGICLSTTVFKNDQVCEDEVMNVFILLVCGREHILVSDECPKIHTHCCTHL